MVNINLTIMITFILCNFQIHTMTNFTLLIPNEKKMHIDASLLGAIHQAAGFGFGDRTEVDSKIDLVKNVEIWLHDEEFNLTTKIRNVKVIVSGR